MFIFPFEGDLRREWKNQLKGNENTYGEDFLYTTETCQQLQEYNQLVTGCHTVHSSRWGNTVLNAQVPTKGKVVTHRTASTRNYKAGIPSILPYEP